MFASVSAMGTVKDLLAKGKATNQDPELAENLESIWNDDLMNQPGMLIDHLPQQSDEKHDEIIRELGRGGMGIVYLAHDKTMDRDVAFKVVPQELSQDQF